MTLQVLNGPNIAAGESLSEGIDCSAGTVIKITLPSEWSADERGSPAVLTFQTSTDGGFYNDIFDQKGNEVTCVVMGASTAIIVDMRVGWVKFRSGTRDRPVPQPAMRQFAIAIDVPGSPAATSTSKKKGG